MVQIKVILDTNFLIYCAENKINYKEEIERLMCEGHILAVPMQVVCELRKMEEKAHKLSDRRAAKLALKLLEVHEVDVISASGDYADQAILNLAKKEGAIVATIDGLLRRKLGKLNRAIIIEGKRKVAWN